MARVLLAPPRFSLWARWAAVCAALSVAGCAAVPIVQNVQDGHSQAVTGDWDDIDAAVRVGVDRNEWAIVRRVRINQWSVGWEVMNVRGEPGWLLIERNHGRPEGAEGARPEIEITARLGRFGLPEQERGLADAIRTRLRQLRGVEAAPIRW